MRLYFYSLFCFLFSFNTCQTGKLTIIGDLPKDIKETSAIETITNSNLLWTIEDSNNKNAIYGLNANGGIEKEITITNAKNKDWEDLTSDNLGNLYIGDFGNNHKKRKQFSIYKIKNINTIEAKTEAEAENITFKLPKKTKVKDFEAFFLWKNNFYIFSKEHKKTEVFKIPNTKGNHTASWVCKLNFETKNNRVTAADINTKNREIILLNHDKMMKINNFKNDDFSTGTVTVLNFNHNSQKEGICYKNDFSVFITDEYNKNTGGNLYAFTLD